MSGINLVIGSRQTSTSFSLERQENTTFEAFDKVSIPGKSFTYEDFTPEQLEALRGEKGEKGDTGDSIHHYHEQLVPASVWVIKHNLNKYPPVAVVDSAGSLVVGEINYDSPNQLTLTFIGEFSGKAYIN